MNAAWRVGHDVLDPTPTDAVGRHCADPGPSHLHLSLVVNSGTTALSRREREG
jgi:hypothetical protein